MEIYGHIYFNRFFKEKFRLSNRVLIFKDVEYTWDKINKVERSFGSFLMNIFMYSRNYPGATIYLKDGNKIRINGRIFGKKNEPLKFDVVGFISSESKTFIETIEFIESKIRT